MTRRLALSTLLLIASPAPVQPQGAYPCAKLVLTLPSADSMEAALPASGCGPVRLVITRPPRLRIQEGFYMPQRSFTLEVAIENVSDAALRVPVSMRADSMSLLRNGRTYGAAFARPYGEFEFWHGQEVQQPWRFRSPSAGAPTLAPGERTAAVTMSLVTDPLATGFVLWLWLDAVARPRDPLVTGAVAGPKLPDIELDRAAERLVAATALPLQRGVQVLYTDPGRGMQFFSVTYGQGQDCVGGCVYSHAIGVSTGSRSGWISIDNYESAPAVASRLAAGRFAMTADDDYLVSAELAEALVANDRRFRLSLARVVRTLSIASPRIPRARLLRLVEGTYTEAPDGILNELLSAPSVRADPELLTLLAFLPKGLEFARTAAERLLVANTQALVADPTTSTRTLFVLVRGGLMGSETALARTIAEHPNGRRSTGVLALLASRFAGFEGDLLASIDAAPDVRARLTHYLAQWRDGTDTTGTALLRDPRTANDLGVLSLLAQIGRQEVRWAACRRLPEEALLCADGFPSRAIR